MVKSGKKKKIVHFNDTFSNYQWIPVLILEPYFIYLILEIWAFTRGRDDISLGRLQQRERAYPLQFVSEKALSSEPNLNLSDIQHNHSWHIRADNAWEASQNSSVCLWFALIHSQTQQKSPATICTGWCWLYKYFTYRINSKTTMARSVGRDPSK